MTSRTRGRVRAGVIAVVLAGLLGAATPLVAPAASAQTPTPTPPPATPTAPATPSPPTEADALAVEHQLLCPLCVNERLDVCSIAICNDMKRIVRERLAEGASTEEIIQFFEQRYGPKVRADLPRSGFNLILFGWVGGALLATAAAAAFVLLSMRRATRRRTAAVAPPPDDAGLDALIAEATGDDAGRDGGGERGAR